jgi:hypothetical protein
MRSDFSRNVYYNTSMEGSVEFVSLLGLYVNDCGNTVLVEYLRRKRFALVAHLL